MNAKTGLPVPDAQLIHSVAGLLGVADESGWIYFLPPPAGSSRELQISAIGYAPQTISWPLDSTVIRLIPRISTLSEVVVNASSRKGIFRSIADLDIHIRPIINSQEVLRIVPGLFIGQHAGGGKAEQLFVRGFDIDHGTDILIRVDGMPVNMVSHAHGQGYADLHFVIPELIRKVNFNKGPYFADKGNFATAGYVDFSTKDYLEQNFAKVEGGQYSTFRVVTGVNLLPVAHKEQQSLYAAAEASFTKGYFEHPQDFSRFNGLLKYHGNAGAQTKLSVTVSGFTSKWNASGQIPDRAVASGQIGWFGAIDSREGGQTSRYNLNLQAQTHFESGWKWQNQLSYSRYLFELYSNFTFYLNDPVNGDQIRQKEARHLITLQSVFSKELMWMNRSALFQAGVQARKDLTSNSELSRTKDRTLVTAALMNGDIRETNLSAFADVQLKVHQRLDLSVGLRADRFSNRYADHLLAETKTSASALVSPKFTLNYRPTNKVQLYWYGGQGFHSNDTRVAVQQNGREVVTPAWGSDLGGIFRIGKKTVLQTAIWYLWLKQEFVYVGDEGVVEPGGQTRRVGWDVSLRHELIPSVYVDADLNLSNPRALGVAKEASYLPLAPRLTSTGGVSYRKEKGWNGSIRYRFMANRPANEDYSVTARGYFVCDAALNYTQPKWELGVSVQNIFNTRWKETQFDTESRLYQETAPVSEIHFTPGSPFFARASLTLFF